MDYLLKIEKEKTELLLFFLLIDQIRQGLKKYIKIVEFSTKGLTPPPPQKGGKKKKKGGGGGGGGGEINVCFKTLFR